MSDVLITVFPYLSSFMTITKEKKPVYISKSEIKPVVVVVKLLDH